MKKACLSGLTALLLFALSACGAADKEPQDPETIVIHDPAADELTGPDFAAGEDALTEPESVTDEDAMAEPESVTDEDAMTEPESVTDEDILAEPDTVTDEDALKEPVQTYQDIYYQAVVDSVGDVRVYSLVYLDEDEIPELVMLNRELDFYSIYTVRNDGLFCMVDSVAAVELVYYERTGMFYEFWRFNGGGDEGDYGRFFWQASADETITEETPCLMQDEYHALYTQDGVLTENGACLYLYQGEYVDEQTYQELLSGFGVTEDGGRPFTENAVGKEEMLALLGR